MELIALKSFQELASEKFNSLVKGVYALQALNFDDKIFYTKKIIISLIFFFVYFTLKEKNAV